MSHMRSHVMSHIMSNMISHMMSHVMSHMMSHLIKSHEVSPDESHPGLVAIISYLLDDRYDRLV